MKVRQNQYPFPTAKELKTQDIENYFLKYFSLKDPHVKLAREGATQVTEFNSKVEFINGPIQNYYIASSLYKYLQDYDKNQTKIPFEKSYLNCHLLEYEDKDISDFLLGMILNEIAEFEKRSESDLKDKDTIFAEDDDKEIKEEGKEEKEAHLDLKYRIKKRERLSPIEENLISILHTATKKNVKETGVQNVMLVCSYLVHLLKEVPDDVQDYMLDEDNKDVLGISNKFKSRLLWAKAHTAKEEGNADEC